MTYHCPFCNGTGRYVHEEFGTTECSCPRGQRLELRPGLRGWPWLAHPASQLRHFLEQVPHRHRRRWIIPVPFALLAHRARWKGLGRRPRSERQTSFLVALLEARPR